MPPARREKRINSLAEAIRWRSTDNIKLQPTRRYNVIRRLSRWISSGAYSMIDYDDSSASAQRRIVSRDSSFHQATGRTINIQRNTNVELNSLRLMRWFNLLLELSLPKLILIFIIIYLATVISFAGLYYLVAHYGHCEALSHHGRGVDFQTFWDCYFFSLETLVSIGYGASDPFFHGCQGEQAAILTTQCLWSFVIDMFALGILYERISRGGHRSDTIVFSDSAVVRPIGSETGGTGAFALEFRVCDVGDRHLLDCAVRSFAVFHGTDEDGDDFYFRPHPVQLVDSSSKLLFCFPTTAQHIMRPDIVGEDRSPLLPLNLPPNLSISEFRRKITSHWLDVSMEIIVLVEGVDPATSCSVQAQHSYVPSEVKWNSKLKKCVSMNSHGACCIDFDLFHGICNAATSPHKSGDFPGNYGAANYVFPKIPAEIIVLVEGVDPATSCSVQAQHSYVPSEVKWNSKLKKCVSMNSHGACCIDFDLFHGICNAATSPHKSGDFPGNYGAANYVFPKIPAEIIVLVE
eukprot:969042_1